MDPKRVSSLIDYAEWAGAGVCVALLYLAGKYGRVDLVLVIVLALFFILTTRAFRTSRDEILEEADDVTLE